MEIRFIMSGKDPIELPGLAAQRRGPSAAVCRSGHLFSWFVDPGAAPQYCAKCGDPILVACPECSDALPADGEMLAWVPYHAYCMTCGKAYPWTAAEIARAKRALAEQAQTGNWSEAVRARADELVADIAGDRATPSWVVAALQWLAEQGAESATETILDTIEKLAGATLKQGLRASYPGRF
jgi:hypothetical protein